MHFKRMCQLQKHATGYALLAHNSWWSHNLPMPDGRGCHSPSGAGWEHMRHGSPAFPVYLGLILFVTPIRYSNPFWHLPGRSQRFSFLPQMIPFLYLVSIPAEMSPPRVDPAGPSLTPFFSCRKLSLLDSAQGSAELQLLCAGPTT